MYKNLSCDLIDITGRQNEIIELALTYGFQGIDVDMDDIVKRCARTSFDSASRFLLSSKLNIATFDAPIDLDADEAAYDKALAQLNGVAEIAGRVGAQTATVTIPNATDRLPYPEYFEVIRKRIAEISGVFAKEEVRLALAFSPRLEPAEEKQFKFIGDVDGFSALVRATSNKNVGIIFDSWSWHLGGGTLEMLQAIGLEKVYSVRLADCREGVEPAKATADDCVLPGSTGVIDSSVYLQAFAEAELNLPVAARGALLTGTATRDAMINHAQDALDKILEQAGLPIVTRKPEFFSHGNTDATQETPAQPTA